MKKIPLTSVFLYTQRYCLQEGQIDPRIEILMWNFLHVLFWYF